MRLEPAQFQTVIDIGFTADPDEQADRWVALLQSLFKPLHLTKGGPAAGDKGSFGELTIPAVDALPSLLLQGRAPFTPDDAALADNLARVLRHLIQARRTAEADGIERKRLATDIHDHVGAPLVSALYSKTQDQKDQLIREALADMRTVLNNTARLEGGLDEALRDLRYESQDRLDAVGIALDWPLEAGAAVIVSAPVIQALRSLIRKTLGDVIKERVATSLALAIHAADGQVQVTIDDNTAKLRLTANFPTG